MTSIANDDLIVEGGVVAQPPVAAQTIINPLDPFQALKAAAVAVTTMTVLVAAIVVVLVSATTRDVIMPTIGEEAVVVGIMPSSAIDFMINTLLSLTQIKSQGKPEFPFVTHPQLMMVSVTSLLIFGTASVAQHVISRNGFDHAAVYVSVARFVRIGSLLVMIASLAAPFYF